MDRIAGQVAAGRPVAQIGERVSPLAARLERIDDERCLLEAGAHSLDALAWHLALLGVELEVREPPELAEHLRAMAARLARAAERS